MPLAMDITVRNGTLILGATYFAKRKREKKKRRKRWVKQIENLDENLIKKS